MSFKVINIPTDIFSFFPPIHCTGNYNQMNKKKMKRLSTDFWLTDTLGVWEHKWHKMAFRTQISFMINTFIRIQQGN